MTKRICRMAGDLHTPCGGYIGPRVFLVFPRSQAGKQFVSAVARRIDKLKSPVDQRKPAISPAFSCVFRINTGSAILRKYH
jgi:hypothetical protein